MLYRSAAIQNLFSGLVEPKRDAGKQAGLAVDDDLRSNIAQGGLPWA
jgi:hypothetical protein